MQKYSTKNGIQIKLHLKTIEIIKNWGYAMTAYVGQCNSSH